MVNGLFASIIESRKMTCFFMCSEVPNDVYKSLDAASEDEKWWEVYESLVSYMS